MSVEQLPEKSTEELIGTLVKAQESYHEEKVSHGKKAATENELIKRRGEGKLSETEEAQIELIGLATAFDID